MEKLRKYLNSLNTSERDAFAERCKSTVGYLRKAISNGDMLNPILCVSIETESNGYVKRKELRQTDWESIWPELKDVA